MSAGDAPKDRAAENRRRAGVGAVIETNGFSRGVETGDRLTVSVEHLAVGIDLQPAEREAVATDDGIAEEWRLRERARPVRLARSEPGIGRELLRTVMALPMDVTGLSNQQSDTATKRLELLRDVVPRLGRCMFGHE